MPEQPYLYDRIEARQSVAYPYSDFNPRAATQAHYAAFQERAERQKRKAQQDGKPLINFNQHPDSYMIIGQPQIDHKPMAPNTKKKVTWARWLQFVLRCHEEIGALGILVCVICLKMANNGPGWIIRVAPAWDSVITMYAIYHLLRPANGRTPNSSASYHFFALFTDTSLIPFYVFIALYAKQNYDLPPGTDDRWTSFFSTEYATTTVIYVTFLASIAIGALHLVSVALDLYLIVMFRKISNLPPDMNPLEDNLTGSNRRRSQKHKYKNSEATVSSVSTDMSEKKAGYLSGSTLDVSDSRLSTAKEPEPRTIPWGHSRMNSDNTYSPHNPNSARLSRQQYDEVSINQGPYSARSSRVDVSGGARSRAGTLVNDGEHGEVVDYGNIPAVPRFATRPLSRQGSPDRHASAPSKDVVKSQQKDSLLNDNWYVLEEDGTNDLGTPRRKNNHGHNREPTLPNVELPPLQKHDSFVTDVQAQPQPLKMNPPTPTTSVHDFAGSETHSDYQPIETGVARTATVQSHATATSSVYSESAPSLKTTMNASPKRKQYGDLASATNGIRGNSPGNLPRFDGSAVRGMYGYPTPQNSRTPSPPKQQQARVVSRTGADIADVMLYGSEQQTGLRGRRDVSGKIAEEGRGGW
ncbi:hypothetical protein HII31_11066 [Pseudocercospora fuligena]|uniref:Uncharacterized protein n=1 Tax=Pseudocercospora fuligena TaxID=685502 RepID=A0A8H6RBX9_9PEZI|nr:hypothetical protein HII31_11066 [Pseudocercospora fuligena]